MACILQKEDIFVLNHFSLVNRLSSANSNVQKRRYLFFHKLCGGICHLLAKLMWFPELVSLFILLILIFLIDPFFYTCKQPARFYATVQ